MFTRTKIRLNSRIIFPIYENQDQIETFLERAVFNMNAYYQQNNIRQIRGNVGSLPTIHVGDKLINFICAIVALFTSAVAVKVEKAVLCTVFFVAFFGVIGGMESGKLSLFVGILLSAGITLIEYFILKSLSSKKAGK